MPKIEARNKPRAVIYARISRDSQAEGLGVSRQLEDCRKLADRLGYEVVAELEDNDISASTKSRKVRPAYNTMLSMAKAGQIDAILAYSNSRLTRRVREYLDLIDLVVKHGVLIKTTVSGDHDLTTADGRAVALTLATWDQAEAERTGERVQRAKKQMRDSGEYRGGRRPFGYQKGALKLKESEAKLVRQATKDVIAGRSLRSIAKEWNEAGSRTSTGVKWDTVNLRDVLARPRNMGYIATGNYKRGNLTILGKAKWKAIVTEDNFRALLSVLDDPSRKTTTGPEQVWLGSGIFRCAAVVMLRDEAGALVRDQNGKSVPALDADGNEVICGGPMRGTYIGQTESRPNHKRRGFYRCVTEAHNNIASHQTDAFVRATVVSKLRDPEVVDAWRPAAPDMSADREARAALERTLDQLARDRADELLDGRQVKIATDRVNARIKEIDDRRATVVRKTASSPIFNSADPGQAFLDAPLDIQKMFVAELVRVEIVTRNSVGLPSGAAWSDERLRITSVEPAA